MARTIKDFSPQPPRPGRRLRIPVLLYDPDRKGFTTVRGMAALVTVDDEREQERLWHAIEETIAGGTWKHGPDDRRADPVVDSLAPV